MNVWLSVCVMGLIMVSCVLHNEPHPHRKAIPAADLTGSTFFSRAACFIIPQYARGTVACINSKVIASKDLFGKLLLQVFQPFVCTLICRC